MSLLMCVPVRTAGEETLQSPGLDSCLILLARGAGGRGEAPDLIALRFSGTADGRKRGRLARAGITLDSLDAVRRTQNIFDHGLLCMVQMREMVGNGELRSPSMA